MRAIFQNGAVPLYKMIIRKLLSSTVCGSLVRDDQGVQRTWT